MSGFHLFYIVVAADGDVRRLAHIFDFERIRTHPDGSTEVFLVLRIFDGKDDGDVCAALELHIDGETLCEFRRMLQFFTGSGIRIEPRSELGVLIAFLDAPQ